MLKNLSAREKISCVALVIFLLAASKLVAFIPGVPAVISEVLFRLEGDTGIVWDALGSKGPGYTKPYVLAAEGDKWNQPGILITFEVEMDTTKAPLLCQGQVRFFRGDPNYLNLDWKDDKCAEQHQIVYHAHYTLNDDGLHTALQEREMYPASSLLMHWMEEGKIKLKDIRNPRMRDLVNSRLHPDPQSSEIKLNGTRWVLQSLNGHELQANTIITLEFDAENIYGRGGCNRYGANYAILPDHGFKISEGGWTEMACSEPAGVMEQEGEYTSAFWSVTSYYRMEENTLFLANEQEDILLEYYLLPRFDVNPEDLMGKTWQLVSSNALHEVKGDAFTLRFDETTLNGTTSCRSYAGTYYAESDILRVLSMSMGAMLTCRNEDSNAEGNYITLLSTTWQYNIADTQLQLYTEFGHQMVFELVGTITYP